MPFNMVPNKSIVIEVAKEKEKYNLIESIIMFVKTMKLHINTNGCCLLLTFFCNPSIDF
jgi:hypothetical protein